MTLDTRNYDAAKRRGVEDLGLRPPERKPRSNEESEIQRAVIKWWQMQCRIFHVPELALLSIPNGGGRSGPKVGAILKAEGLRKGAPDLFLACPRNWNPERVLGTSAHGLFLELKTRDGRLSPEQEVYHEILSKQGYAVVVCRSTMDAINQIITYLTR